MRKIIFLLGFVLALVGLTTSCTTSKGGAVRRTAERDSQRTSPRPETPSNRGNDETSPSWEWDDEDPSWESAPPPPPARVGYSIQSSPSGALVYFDGVYAGVTPYEVEASASRTAEITLKLEGYRSESFYFSSVDNDWTEVHRILTPILGQVLLRGDTQGAEITTESLERLSPGRNALRIGRRTISARKFGWEDIVQTITVTEDGLTELDLSWVPLSLGLKELKLLPDWKVDPDAVGFSFQVTAPGTGVIKVLGADGSLQWEQKLGPFTTWDQDIRWTPDPSTPPGAYKAEVFLDGVGSAGTLNFQLAPAPDLMNINRFWSSGAGALFSPRAWVPEEGYFGINLSSLIQGGEGYIHTLNNVGVVFSPAPTLEMSLGAAARIWNDSWLNSWYLTGSLKKEMTKKGDFIRTALYGTLSLSAFFEGDTLESPVSDPFTNPLGFKGGAVMTFGQRGVRVSLAPELAWAWAGVSTLPGEPTFPGLIGYLRTAVEFDIGRNQLVFSGAMRTRNPTDSWGWHLPIQAGGELRFSNGVNLFTTGEYYNPDQWSLYFGFGLSAGFGGEPEDPSVRAVLPPQ